MHIRTSESEATYSYYLRNSLYGEELVRACAESGTHLIDITGEMLWIDNMIQR